MIESPPTDIVPTDSAIAGPREPVVGAGRAAPLGARARPARLGAALRGLRRSPSALVGLLIVLFWVVCAVIWPLLVRYDPAAQDYTALLAPPSGAHLLGADQYGRDVWTRVLAGSREVLILAPAATLIGLVGGLVVGLLTAYYRGWFDEIVMRAMDAVMAFPVVVLALLVLAIVGPSQFNVILIIGLTYIPLSGRIIRAAALSVRDLDYVSAARLRGARGPAIILTEILPNISGPIVVEGTVRIGYAVFAAASLSFIGLGVQPPSPDWGAMINDAHVYITTAPWIVLAPTLAIASLVVGINLLADGLQRAQQS